MNTNNLHELINRYEEQYAFFNNKENNEIFKWKAVEHFHNVWFGDKTFDNFAELFKEAKKECDVLIDNANVSPTNGIVKLAEKYPNEVEHLFRNVLFAEENGNIDLKQEHMEQFLGGIESLRQAEFPRFYKYKQDRHAASCYMAFVDPEHNFIYRFSEAEELANNIEFGIDIGAGENFSLKNYYELCDTVVEAFKEHPTLLEKYNELIHSGPFYDDQSLHLLAFDFMYCARAYNLYDGISHISKHERIKSYKLEQLRTQEELAKQKKIEELEAEIRAVEMAIEPYRDISLINVEATHELYGTGIVIEQNINKVKVKFSDCEKTFEIHKKYSKRPIFEDDKNIVEAFSVYGDGTARINRLKEQLRLL